MSVDADPIRALTGASRKERKPRSRLVEDALHLWRRSQLEQALKDGYRAMAKEDRATTERNLRAGWETLE